MEHIELDVTPQGLGKWLAENFHGWHYTGPETPQRTVLAVIPRTKEKGKSTVRNALREAQNRPGVTDIGHGTPQQQHAAQARHTEFVRMLHNAGTTLQSRAEAMILTRPLRALVKGASAAHVATICTVEGHVVFTEAYRVVEATAVQIVVTEALKLLCDTRGGWCSQKTTLHKLRPRAQGRDSPNMKKLKEAPQVSTLFAINPGIQPEPCALLIQATAIVITGYEDAGAKFRDRSARHEAARHQGNAVRAILMAPART